MRTLVAFMDSVDQDQTAQNVQSDHRSTLSTFCILDRNLASSSSCNGRVFLANEKAQFIYLAAKEVKDLRACLNIIICLHYFKTIETLGEWH